MSQPQNQPIEVGKPPKNYNVVHHIGNGGYSNAYSAFDKDSDNLICLKVMKRNTKPDQLEKVKSRVDKERQICNLFDIQFKKMWSNQPSFEEWKKSRTNLRQKKWVGTVEDINGDKFPEFVVRDDKGFIQSADRMKITVPIKRQMSLRLLIIERNQLRMSKSKKQIEDMKKELSEEDKLRLQSIDQALRNLSAPQQEIKDDITKDEVRPKRHYNKNKYKEVERETAQVEPEEVVKNTFLAHPNLEVLKFVIDCIWRVTTSRKRGDDFILNSDNFIKFWSLITQENEDDIEIILEEPLMQAHSCMTKKYKKKDLVRVMDVLIKNVSISVIDNVLWNSVEKLYRVNKDFVRLSDKPASEIDINEF
ncbi:MAG: hypothetical protein EZS28_010097 [Streblomastix strix]|uniref:Protein kinase domain-containing protein n=1 Tax=Streblomastix strix TaxID=222440 RepID=A0A5J4WJB1_9EUKA|nr:MAG: hypothetical protein EZS28_010097 [Streblomastix strix]